jgi:hypothetical protein
MVLDALRVRWDDPDAARHGRRGQRQHGVDIYGRPKDLGGAYAGAQCRNVQNPTIEEVRAEAEKAELFIPKLERFYFVAASPRDSSLQEGIRVLSERRVADGRFRVEVLFHEDVCMEIAKQPDLVARHWTGWKRDTGDLQLVDATVADQRPPTTMDLKLRNTSREVCYIKRVDFEVQDIGIIETNPIGFSQQFITAEYDIDLDPRVPPPYSDAWPVSQVVAADGTDRFAIRISYPDDYNWASVSEVLVQGRFDIYYNETDSVLSTDVLLFSVPPPRVVLGRRVFRNAEHLQRERKNGLVFDRMLALAGQASPRVKALRSAHKHPGGLLIG